MAPNAGFPESRRGAVPVCSGRPGCSHGQTHHPPIDTMSSRNPHTESNRSAATHNPELDSRSKDADLERDRHRNEGEDRRTNEGGASPTTTTSSRPAPAAPAHTDIFSPTRMPRSTPRPRCSPTRPRRSSCVFPPCRAVAGRTTRCASDFRGFAPQFYTSEGIWDLVGNNMPVFFIQDALKFPDFVHAVKPEPHNEIPQGQVGP